MQNTQELNHGRNFPLTNQKNHDTAQNPWEFLWLLHSIGNGDDQPDTL